MTGLQRKTSIAQHLILNLLTIVVLWPNYGFAAGTTFLQLGFFFLNSTFRQKILRWRAASKGLEGAARRDFYRRRAIPLYSFYFAMVRALSVCFLLAFQSQWKISLFGTILALVILYYTGYRVPAEEVYSDAGEQLVIRPVPILQRMWPWFMIFTLSSGIASWTLGAPAWILLIMVSHVILIVFNRMGARTDSMVQITFCLELALFIVVIRPEFGLIPVVAILCAAILPLPSAWYDLKMGAKEESYRKAFIRVLQENIPPKL